VLVCGALGSLATDKKSLLQLIDATLFWCDGCAVASRWGCLGQLLVMLILFRLWHIMGVLTSKHQPCSHGLAAFSWKLLPQYLLGIPCSVCRE